MSAVSTEIVPGPWTYADLEQLPDDGHRYEIVDGMLLVNAAPVPRHQRVQMRLLVVLDRHCPEGWWVMPAPLDIVLAEDTVVEPDLLVAPKAEFGPKYLPVAPLLAVEVLSPSTRVIDLNLKKDRYERAGIASYWLVDPDELRLVAYELSADGRYQVAADVSGEQSWSATAPFPVTITPAALLD